MIINRGFNEKNIVGFCPLLSLFRAYFLLFYEMKYKCCFRTMHKDGELVIYLICHIHFISNQCNDRCADWGWIFNFSDPFVCSQVWGLKSDDEVLGTVKTVNISGAKSRQSKLIWAADCSSKLGNNWTYCICHIIYHNGSPRTPIVHGCKAMISKNNSKNSLWN